MLLNEHVWKQFRTHHSVSKFAADFDAVCRKIALSVMWNFYFEGTVCIALSAQ